MTKYAIRVLLVDDHALFRESVAEIFAKEQDIKVVGEATNGLEAVELAEREKPDVVLLDVEMPKMGAESAIGRILRTSPSSKVIILSEYDEPRLVHKLLSLGAHAYITKKANREELVAAVRALHKGRDRILSVSPSTLERLEGKRGTLSDRELEILLLIARAMSARQVASQLDISGDTVRRHLTNIYRKLGVSSRAEAINKALTSGLLTVRDLLELAPL